MRILLLRGGALGDFIITLPVIGLLRRMWPAASIELVGNAAAAEVACGPGRHYLDAVHSQHEARWSRIGSGRLADDAGLARWLGGFDLVISFWPDDDRAIAADFAAIGFEAAARDLEVADARPEVLPHLPVGTRRRLFVSHPAAPVRAPAAAHFCAALEPLGIAASRDDPGARVFTTGADRAAARALVGEACSLPLVALHPGSGSPRKNWPIDHWVRVLGELHRETPCRVVAIVGEVESESWERSRVADALPPDALFVRNAPTPILAALFERCALFLGHDSGPAHLAAAAGCPCVLVFGPTDPEMWAPPHPWVRSIRRGGSPTDTSVGDVVACARTILSPV